MNRSHSVQMPHSRATSCAGRWPSVTILMAPDLNAASYHGGALPSGFLEAVMQNPLPSFHPQDLMIGGIGAAAIWLVVYFRKKNAKITKQKKTLIRGR